MISYTDLQDCKILLTRALLNKSVSAFGEDGHGEHGASPRAAHFNISKITLLITQPEDATHAVAVLQLAEYSARDVGHVSTDRNLCISLNKYLVEHDIDPACWSFAAIQFQGDSCFTIDLNVQKLLQY